MVYLRHIPSPPLDAYIDLFYYLSGQMPYSRTKILPLPMLDLKVNLGGALQLREVQNSESHALAERWVESWVVGIWSACHAVYWPPDLRLFGVSFKPDGAYPFLQLPLFELRNQAVPLDALWARFAAEIRERLYDAPTPQAGFDLLERLLLARLSEVPYGLDVVHHATAEIARQHGALSIRTLSDQIGVSQNHLGSLVKRMVGSSPKELARLYRFDHVLRSLDPTHAVDWMLVAHQAGYYDQSHLNKDFLAFTGHNPTDYERIRHQESVRVPEGDRILRILPSA